MLHPICQRNLGCGFEITSSNATFRQRFQAGFVQHVMSTGHTTNVFREFVTHANGSFLMYDAVCDHSSAGF